MRTRLQIYIHLSVATDKGTEINSVYTMRTRLQMYIHLSVATEFSVYKQFNSVPLSVATNKCM
jgi:hypothetical protein